MALPTMLTCNGGNIARSSFGTCSIVCVYPSQLDSLLQMKLELVGQICPTVVLGSVAQAPFVVQEFGSPVTSK